MSAVDEAVKKVDSLINYVEMLLVKEKGVEEAEKSGYLDELKTRKVDLVLTMEKCPDCGYERTIPFESRCPVCFFKHPETADAVHMGPVKFDIEAVAKGMKDDNAEEKKEDKKEEEKDDKKEQSPLKKNAKMSKKQAKKAEKADKKKQPKAPQVEPTVFDHLLKARLQVSSITTCEPHPNPEVDELWVCQLDIGGGETRQLCAGLRKFYTKEELVGKKIISILNLSPKKLRDVESSAMLLAGSVKDGETKSTVKILVPPENAQVGERVHIGDVIPDNVCPKKLASKFWMPVVEKLSVLNGIACLDGKPLKVGNADISCPLPDGAEIH